MKLMVSYDCGINYGEEGSGSLDELQEKAIEMRLDERWLRWVIESDDGKEIVEVSCIHKGIVDFMERLRRGETPERI